jgi:hypothetical protein
MASWRERWTWWREFRRVGTREVEKRVARVTWANDAKLREARRLDADTDHPGEQAHHRMRPRIRAPARAARHVSSRSS